MKIPQPKNIPKFHEALKQAGLRIIDHGEGNHPFDEEIRAGLHNQIIGKLGEKAYMVAHWHLFRYPLSDEEARAMTAAPDMEHLPQDLHEKITKLEANVRKAAMLKDPEFGLAWTFHWDDKAKPGEAEIRVHLVHYLGFNISTS